MYIGIRARHSLFCMRLLFMSESRTHSLTFIFRTPDEARWMVNHSISNLSIIFIHNKFPLSFLPAMFTLALSVSIKWTIQPWKLFLLFWACKLNCIFQWLYQLPIRIFYRGSVCLIHLRSELSFSKPYQNCFELNSCKSLSFKPSWVEFYTGAVKQNNSNLNNARGNV